MLSRSLVFRWGHVGWGIALGALVASACGGSSSDNPPFVPGQTGTGGKGHLPQGGKGGEGGEAGSDTGVGGTGATGNTNTGATGGELPAEPGAPTVTITSPKAVSDPNKGNVLIDTEVEVRCTVAKADGGRPVAASSVTVQMLDADGNVVPT